MALLHDLYPDHGRPSYPASQTHMIFRRENRLEIGDQAPAFDIETATGEHLSLAALYARGPVLIFFFPKAFTPGCTAQVCNLRDDFDALRESSITVIGVSRDSTQRQSRFQKELRLPFLLVPDPTGQLGRAFGVSSLLGLAHRRETFLIVDGRLAWHDPSAKPSSQSHDALAALNAIQKAE